MLLLLLSGLADAYETDQLTDREIALADAAMLANEEMNHLLRDAIAETRARLGCSADDDTVRRRLAANIARRATKPRTVPQRGGFRRFGFQEHSYFLETDPRVERRAFYDRDDLFGDLTPWHSVVLTYAGPSSTVNVAGHLVGTDKFDHFLHFGHKAWVKSRNGARETRALKWSTRTERRFFGLVTSKTFSWGDLKANWDGYEMYAGLLGPDSVVSRDPHGCPVLTRSWDWGAWVGWEYDEALNPPVFTRLVHKGVQKRLQREPDRYCRAWHELGGPAYQEHLQRVVAEPVAYGAGRMPDRADPYQLAALCVEHPEDDQHPQDRQGE